MQKGDPWDSPSALITLRSQTGSKDTDSGFVGNWIRSSSRLTSARGQSFGLSVFTPRLRVHDLAEEFSRTAALKRRTGLDFLGRSAFGPSCSRLVLRGPQAVRKSVTTCMVASGHVRPRCGPKLSCRWDAHHRAAIDAAALTCWCLYWVGRRYEFTLD